MKFSFFALYSLLLSISENCSYTRDCSCTLGHPNTAGTVRIMARLLHGLFKDYNIIPYFNTTNVKCNYRCHLEKQRLKLHTTNFIVQQTV